MRYSARTLNTTASCQYFVPRCPSTHETGRKSGLLTIVALVAVAASVTLSAQSAQGLNHRQGDLALTLDCVDSTHITFAIRNVGESDTAVRLGNILSNGAKYTVADLHLRQKTTTGQITESHYYPRRYPVRVGGNLEEWIQPIPARSSYVMSAEPDDFWAFRVVNGPRPLPFYPGVELSLRLTIPEPRPEAMLRFYWSGTLTSNSCTP